MPGIVGLVTMMPRELAEPQLMRMVATLRHESFYTAGTWIDEQSGLYIGWVARKGSFSERMPVRNELGDVVLVFSGEEFPDPGIAKRLKEEGHDLDLDGPSYLAHLYESDPTYPAGLNGRFHGFLTDRHRKTSLLFNDRYGMHRIYYHESRDAFYFAAEAKSILAVRPELRSLDARAMGEIVSSGAVLENRTLFSGIKVLPAASAWIFSDGVLSQRNRYFHPEQWEAQEPLDSEAYYRELRTIFTQNLPRYFTGSEQIGMSLTGGLDTRMLLACRKPAPGSLPCYTFGSSMRENQDVRVARRVAAVCEQSHQTLAVGGEFLSQFRKYAERSVYLTDGCVDVSRSPDLYLNERARELAPVRMTGNYGGEVLRGVRAFKPAVPAGGVFSPEFLSHVHRAAVTYGNVLHRHPVSFAAFQQAPWALHGVLTLEQTQLTMRSPYLDNDFVRTVFRSPQLALTSNEVSLRLIADGNPELLRIPTDRGLVGKRAGVLAGTSRGILEFTFKAEYAFDMGMPQWLARIDHALSPLRLDSVFLGRHKSFHFRVWYRDALAGYIQETLLDPRSLSRPYIERAGLEAMVRSHVRGDRNYTTELHKVLTLELLHRIFLEGSGSQLSPEGVQYREMDQLHNA